MLQPAGSPDQRHPRAFELTSSDVDEEGKGTLETLRGNVGFGQGMTKPPFHRGGRGQATSQSAMSIQNAKGRNACRSSHERRALI